MSKNNGGPAFPIPGAVNGIAPGFGGMTLRDYFAAKAMAALISGAMANGIAFETDSPPVFAYIAYAIADAMLEEREK